MPFSLALAAGQVSASSINVAINPEVPGPNTNTSITLSSYATDINRALISWTLDGKTMQSGIGKTIFSFTTKGVGTATTVTVNISIDLQPAITKTIVITPADVDMLWEAIDSYVPPFYKGKAMPSSEAKIKVTAMPNIKGANGVKIKSSDMVYNWKHNYDNDPNGSGYGKDSYIVNANYLNNSEIVDLSVSSVSNSSAASGRAVLVTGDPKIVFYQKDPLEGIKYENALKTDLNLSTDETTLVAEPYFFSPADINSSKYKYTWNINGSAVDTPAKKNVMTLRKGPTGGTANISLEIENVLKLFQDAKQNLNINF